MLGIFFVSLQIQIDLYMKRILLLAFVAIFVMPTVSAQVTDFYHPGGFDNNGASIKTFSVSDNDAVQFSRGNLQYNPALDKWRFALRQYDYACGDNANIAQDYDGWIDLFGWGTSGWNSGANAYQPWATSTTGGDYYPGGSENHNLTGEYANADWGIYNKIENGGKSKGMWRTLTNGEWIYLKGDNAKRSGKWALATIAGIHKGLLLLPDEWTLPSGCSYTAGAANRWETNRYSYAEWEKMQAAGAVFMPAAGQRYEQSITGTNEWGAYWINTTNASTPTAYVLNIEETGVGNTTRPVGGGLSVRLVRRVQTPLVQNGWVDMGLPSGTLWYSCNIGTTKPQGYGTYFAWGETHPKAEYATDWSNYAYGTGEDALTKYYDGDGLTVLELGDDAARAAMGGNARIPNETEWQELIDNCTFEWTKLNGVQGCKLTSNANGRTLFLPACGAKGGTEVTYASAVGMYWTSSLTNDDPSAANSMYINQGGSDMNSSSRIAGLSVRPVKSPIYQEWVDLGLPSGTKWYSCNIGATKPWEYGSYFAWGETTEKDSYDWSNYAYGTRENKLTKYCTDASYGLDGFEDTLTVLQSSDDAATVKLGGGARMPTQTEWQELVDNCNWEWTTMNGVNGYKVTSNSNGASLFLPATGYRDGSSLGGDGTGGYYWSSSLGTGHSRYARYFRISSGGSSVYNDYRYIGFSVRAMK